MNLAEVQKGKEVVVVSVSESGLRSKLMELGIIPGKKLTILFTAPFGDPIAVDMGGFTLSLRKDEAQMISVEF